MTPSKKLLVASTGGHLTQLRMIADAMKFDQQSVWITFCSPQSRSILEGETTVFVPYVAPRDWRSMLQAVPQVWRVLRRERFTECISTGAGIAIVVFILARLWRIPCTYIESVSRTDGPSLTGKLIASLSLAKTFTQHASWQSRQWELHDSVLRVYKAQTISTAADLDSTVRKLFVTLGTIRPYRFDRLCESIVVNNLSTEQTTWQLGDSYRTDLPGQVSKLIKMEEFERHVTESEVVITHAGVGSILKILELGKFPVVVPRRSEFGEHIDDHQLQIAALISREGVGIVCDASQLSSDVLEYARRREVVRAEQNPEQES